MLEAEALGGPSPRERKEGVDNVAYGFPGQGSQSVGMGKDLYDHSPAARRVFEEANDVLGFDLSGLIFEGPANQLQNTANSQPAILTASVATLKAMEEQLGEKLIKPAYETGHSLGEYTSFVATDVLEFGETVRLVRQRGILMQDASKKTAGGMAAIIGLNQAVLEEICAETGVEIGNINSDEQIVLTGEKIALARAMDLASARGARKTLPLPVSGAFHSALMADAQEGLKDAISGLKFKDPKIPIIANSAKIITTAGDVKTQLINGMCQPVNWRDSVRLMTKRGVKSFIELGPGNVLSALAKRIDRNLKISPVNSLESLTKMQANLP